MKFRFPAAAFGALIAIGAAAASADTPRPEAGFQTARGSDGAELAIWFPTTGNPVERRMGIYQQAVVFGAAPSGARLPLVVISHGSGSSNLAHYDTAIALAKAGFVVVAVTHVGDNWQDHSKATDLVLRTQTLHSVISYMLDGWAYRAQLDPKRVGAFGYSAGAFTVLAAAGGKPKLERIPSHCERQPAAFECVLLNGRVTKPAPWAGQTDRRIKALVVAAPALGYTFDRQGLRTVTLPVQLWRADADQLLPAPFYADAVFAALPKKAEFQAVPGAGHFDFMAPCAPGGPSLPICQTASFNRAAFHDRFNAAVVAFFKARLRG